jgi:hypothetical protein
MSGFGSSPLLRETERRSIMIARWLEHPPVTRRQALGLHARPISRAAARETDLTVVLIPPDSRW